MMQVSGVVDLSPICYKSNLPFTAVSFVYFAHEATFFFHVNVQWVTKVSN